MGQQTKTIMYLLLHFDPFRKSVAIETTHSRKLTKKEGIWWMYGDCMEESQPLTSKCKHAYSWSTLYRRSKLFSNA